MNWQEGTIQWALVKKKENPERKVYRMKTKEELTTNGEIKGLASLYEPGVHLYMATDWVVEEPFAPLSERPKGRYYNVFTKSDISTAVYGVKQDLLADKPVVETLEKWFGKEFVK